MNLTDEQKAIGKDNFAAAIGSEHTRRKFLKNIAATGAVSGAGLGAVYFGYEKSVGDPVRVGLIGTGDEGGVLIGAITPSYLQVVAVADIRPYNIHRIFHGDPGNKAARPGLMNRYKWKTEAEAKKNVKVYAEDYHDLLADKDVEAVIIALPLHLHGKVAIEAMRAGKHVMSEKLMAHSVTECKEMARVATATDKLLTVGHQRHYSVLYDNAVKTIRAGLIGDIHHIRAQWHRQKDTWLKTLPAKATKDLPRYIKELASDKTKPDRRAAVAKRVKALQLIAQDDKVDAAGYGYISKKLAGGYECSALEERIRWRLWDRTGGGLMAELGSHQLDAASIFISALRKDGHHAMPLSVSAMGGRHLYKEDRDTDDHVYCSFEFPSPKHDEDPAKKIVVTYSSINGNGFGGYGEVVLGTKGTLILSGEKEAMLFKDAKTSTSVGVVDGKKGLALDSYETSGDVAVGQSAVTAPVSRGYTEEMEHFAWCIRNRDPENIPRCHPKVAMADAIIALTSNIALKYKKHIEYKKEWFDIDNDATPEMDVIPEKDRAAYAKNGINIRKPDMDPKLANYPKSTPNS